MKCWYFWLNPSVTCAVTVGCLLCYFRPFSHAFCYIFMLERWWTITINKTWLLKKQVLRLDFGLWGVGLDVHTLDSCYSRPPAIHNDLLDLAGAQDKVVLRTPLCQMLHLYSVVHSATQSLHAKRLERAGLTTQLSLCSTPAWMMDTSLLSTPEACW